MLIALALLLGVVQSAPQPPPACAAATAFTGTICVPSTSGKHPAILLLGGSEGGNSLSGAAATYAQRGYLAASVAYFRAPGLPQTLEEIPVETVGAALSAVAQRDDVDPERIAIFGISKGGELALLAASIYPKIHAVIADVPSPFAWEGVPAGASSVHLSSWTVGGKPVPYVPYADGAMGNAFTTAFTSHTPLELRPGYDASMNDRGAIDHAMFALEKINGPVFFLSAGDDRIWNSREQSRIGLAYLQKHDHRFADQSNDYPEAGHAFTFAATGRPLVEAPFGGGLTLLLGGTPKANAEAAGDAFPRIVSFLQTALQSR